MTPITTGIISEFMTHEVGRMSNDEKATIFSVRGPEASNWLTALPKQNSSQMSNDEFKTALCLRLGIPLPFIPNGTYCDCRKHTLVDLEHLNSCPKGKERIAKHNGGRDVIGMMCSHAGLRVVLEPRNCYPTQQGKPLRVKPDIKLIGELTNADCKEILLEFSLTNPCRTALLKSKPPEPLLAAKDRFTYKMAKFNKVDDDHS
jgi:hypothetical protein